MFYCFKALKVGSGPRNYLQVKTSWPAVAQESSERLVRALALCAVRGSGPGTSA